MKLNHEHVVSLYIAIGGAPYYLKYVEPGLTAQQNIEVLLYQKSAPLKYEFNLLFSSLFDDAGVYKELLKGITKKREGIEVADSSATSKNTISAGSLTQKLKELNEAGFVEQFIPWNRTRGEYYKLIDEFSLFFILGQESPRK